MDFDYACDYCNNCDYGREAVQIIVDYLENKIINESDLHDLSCCLDDCSILKGSFNDIINYKIQELRETFEMVDLADKLTLGVY